MSTEESNYLVAVFPYLKTSQAFPMRGLLFRNTDNLEGLSEEEKEDVERIRQRFYLRNGYRIDKMTYTLRQFTSADEKQLILERIAEVRLLLTYLYSAPDEIRCDVFLAKEHCSVCVFEKHAVNGSLVRPEDNTVLMNRKPDSPKTDHRGEVEGWYVTRDEHELFYAEHNSHIYSTLGRMWFNLSQDLHGHFVRVGSVSGRHEQVLKLLWSPYVPNRGIERVKTAIGWYNRSVSEVPEPDVQIVSLAIAFESLLDLDQAKSTTARFVETVQTLLGRNDRLELWLTQFYNARSGVVHKGQSNDLMFRVKLATWTSEYRSLVDYGRHIFRACVETILRGTELSEVIGIPALLTTNRERFDRICQVMRGTESPDKKLKMIAADVEDIDRSRYVQEGALTPEVQIAAVQTVVEQYLGTSPAETEEVRNALEEVSKIKARGDELANLTAIKRLQEAFMIAGHLESASWPPIPEVVRKLVGDVWSKFSIAHWFLQDAKDKKLREAAEVQIGE